MRKDNIPANSSGGWRIGKNFCAFADSERHLGHVLKFESQWLACDGTRLGENWTGFRIIGIYPDIESAKKAVELAAIDMWAPAAGAAAVM